VVPVPDLKLIEQRGKGRTGTVLFGGQSYENALAMEGHQDTAWMEFYLGKRYARFQALVGVSDLAQQKEGTMTYIVQGDGKELARTPPLRVGTPPQALDVPVSGVLRLRLVATSTEWWAFSGDQSGFWVNPRVTAGGCLTPPTMAKIILNGNPLTTSAPIVNGEPCVPFSVLRSLSGPLRSMDWNADRSELVIETQ
jgi:hypothetical protein